ncbi:MAG: succinate dehydrogenase, hydrophobic membrane anchor protein [Anaerolineae bacterium]|jgi:succinate dehydrogenase / fumarate reductase membrane anchor subunit
MSARNPARPRPASNFELYSWFFMRISAVALFVLATFHLVYMHIVLGVDAINFEVIAQRWQSPGWRLYDLFLLIFGWIHGANGVRIVLDDYIHPQGWKVLAKSILYVVTFILIVLGAYVIFTFKP